MLNILSSIRWQDIVDIIIVSYFLYRLFLLIKGTRAVQMLFGLLLLVIASFIAELGQFYTISWILKNFLTLWVLVFIIVFQPELRKALAQMGQSRFLNIFEHGSMIDEIVEASVLLSEKRYGALIVIEREIGLKNFIETGVMIHGKISSELLTSIFYPNTPLHDGAVIIHNSEIAAAACILPLSSNPEIKPKNMGTRHRAAIGITEETDAVVVVVSEESRSISISIGGKMTRNLDKDNLKKVLRNIFSPQKTKSSEKRDFFKTLWKFKNSNKN
ncbi:MAG: TIGR00159 family protein [Candidatus Firestonebacteria bacterium]|nr:TIGR00159 family protein [Candidatus Firestonebacteria bacterium]